MECNPVQLSKVITSIATGPFGSNLKVSCFVDSGFPVIDGANLKGLKLTDNLTKFVTKEKAESLARSIAKRGDVVVTISGTLGQIAYIPEDSLYPEYLCSQRQFKVSFDQEKVYVPYLVYYFHTREGQSKILSFANQTGVPALAQPTKNFQKIEVGLPTLEEQKRIVKVAELLTAKMELNQQINGYLEELCDALFLDYLERADSSWHEGTLEELAEVKYGKDHKKLADGPYPVYGSGGFMRSAEKSLFSGESVLIPRKGSLNNVMYVNGAFWTVDTMFFTVPRIAGAAKFLYQYVKRLDLASMNFGSAVPSMTISILNALSLPVPPRDSLLSFNAKLQSMYDAVRANNLENRRLESLRDSLLPKLMAGEIDVSKIDLTQLNSHLA